MKRVECGECGGSVEVPSGSLMLECYGKGIHIPLANMLEVVESLPQEEKKCPSCDTTVQLPAGTKMLECIAGIVHLPLLIEVKGVEFATLI